ncbi:MAG: hypothetical protein ACLPJH_02325 [Myxococcaceae bacterium]
MFKFNDKWRRRLLEDALVADLLEFPLDGRPSSFDEQGVLRASAATHTADESGESRAKTAGA